MSLVEATPPRSIGDLPRIAIEIVKSTSRRHRSTTPYTVERREIQNQTRVEYRCQKGGGEGGGGEFTLLFVCLFVQYIHPYVYLL